MSQFLIVCLEGIHHLQKERGMSGLYLRSQTKQHSVDIEQQYKLTDNALESIRNISGNYREKFAFFNQQCTELIAKRTYAVSRMLKAEEIIEFYTQALIAPLLILTGEIAIADPQLHPAKVSAFINFMQWKERVGMERALGAQLATPDWINNFDLSTKLRYLIGEQDSFERMFLGLANAEQASAYQNIKKLHPVFEKIDVINRSIMDGKPLQTLKAFSASEWFDIFSAKIDLLHEVVKFLASHLVDEGGRKEHVKINMAMLDGSVESHFSAIETLSLFAGMDREHLRSILGTARVVHHDRGTVFLKQGEHVTRFYAVLGGWIKIFKGNEEGDESVLQIIGRGGNLLESSTIDQTTCPVNAQAVDAVTLLSIPAAVMREAIKNNTVLATNLLSAVTQRSQLLINHVEQLTLRNAVERVGWFLLRLKLEQHDDTSSVQLPFDKSLIASYLGIKPETFSRALQTLRDDGFQINKQTITLPDKWALCAYCDHDVTQKCRYSNTADCLHSEAGAQRA